MANSIDPAYNRFITLKPEIEAAFKTSPNESDTRLKVLDRFLFEVLEWKQEAIFTEPPTPSGYIDYLLTIGERRGAVIIEAKRFKLLQPATKGDEVMHVALSGPVLKPLLPGIKQALNYAMENGVPVAAVTDGNTWLFFRASRPDGKPPLSGKGVLFPGLKAVQNNFAKFAELLNVGAIIDRRHLAHLNEAEGVNIPRQSRGL
jgi:predicted type IV restriction endonuclease